MDLSKTMQKRKNIFIVLSLGLLLVLLAATYFYLKYQEYSLKHQQQLTARRYLLCDVLQPGMSVDEVLGVLHQTGEFTMNKAEWAGGSIELGIYFTDPKNRELYSGFELGFSNYKYDRAFISGFDYFELICIP